MIKNCYEINEGRTSRIVHEPDGIQIREYYRIFQIETDDATDDAGYVKTNAPLPVYKQPYVTPSFTDARAMVKAIEVSPSSESQYLWIARVMYDNKPQIFDCKLPLCCPPRWSVSGQKTKEVVQLTIDNKMPVNSAGMPMVIERERTIPIITIKWSSYQTDITVVSKWADSVNASLWNGFPPGTIKFETLNTQDQLDPVTGIYYWDKTLQVTYKYDGWQAVVLDCGTHEFDPSKNAIGRKPYLVPCRDAQGQPVGFPVPLDGNGQQLKTGANPVWRTFLIYRTVDYTDIIDFPNFAYDCDDKDVI